MKQFYLFLLSTFLLIGITNQASADVSTTITWDTPGSVVIYVGGTGEKNKVSIPDDATSYEAKITGQSYGSTYVRAAEGYYIVDGYCVDNDKTIAASAWGTRQLIVNMSDSQYGGKTVHVNVEKLDYDATMEVNVVNGAKSIAATLGGTGRALTFKTGTQSVAFSSKFEKTLTVSYGSTTQTKDPYLKKNDENMSGQDKFGTYTFSEFAIADGDRLEMKVSDTPDETATSEITFTGDAIPEGFVTSIMEGITRLYIEDGKLTAEKGKKLKFNFNASEKNFVLTCGDYTLSVTDGTANETKGGVPLLGDECYAQVNIDSSSGNTYVFWQYSFDEDATINLTFTDRTYPKVNLVVTIDHPEGVTLRYGSNNGEIVDLSQFTPDNGTYTIPVSSRLPKIFFESNDGWWVRTSVYRSPDGKNDYAGVISTETSPVRMEIHKIEKNAKFYVYAAGDIDKIYFRDGQGEVYPIVAGYNEFSFDPIYNAGNNGVTHDEVGFKAQFRNLDSKLYYVNLNSNPVMSDPDSESSYPITGVQDNSIIDLFSNTAPAYRDIEMAIGDNTTKVMYHRIYTHDNAETSLHALVGSEIEITPREGSVVKVNGTELPAPAANAALSSTTQTVTVDENTEKIEVVYAGNANVATTNPANGETVSDLSEITISFPEASEAELIEAGIDEIGLRTTDNQWAPIPGQLSISKVEDASVPTFAIKIDPAPTALKQYALNISEGFFKVDGDLASKEINATFTLEKAVSLEYTFDPYVESPVISEYANPYGTVVFEEGTQVTINDLSKITVKLNGTVLENTTDYKNYTKDGYYMAETFDNMFSISTTGTANTGKASTLQIILEAGALTVSGHESPAIDHTWNFVEPKEYIVSITPEPQEGKEYSKLDEFYISFIGAETAKLNESMVANPVLREDSYMSGSYQNNSGVIESVPDQENPTFKVTFTPAPSKKADYIFSINEGKFLLDAAEQWSPAIRATYTFNDESSVTEIDAEMEGAAIFTVDGRIITLRATAETIRSLEPGIYIINNKKVIKK